MTLDDFRALDNPEGDQNAARCYYVGNLIIGQNPRLRLGDNMPSPACRFFDGRISSDEGTEPHLDPPGTLVTSKVLTASVAQILNYHPFLRFDAGEYNYLHMFTVDLVHPFEPAQAGDLISATYNSISLKVPLTQQQIDEHTVVQIRYSLSV